MATFHIEALTNCGIQLSKTGNPEVGNAYYGVNDPSVPNVYRYGNWIALLQGQKCYFTIAKTSTAFSLSNFLQFKVTDSNSQLVVRGALSDLIGGETVAPRDYCFAALFYDLVSLVDASELELVSDFNGHTFCYYAMFQGCTKLRAGPPLTAADLPLATCAYMFRGDTGLEAPPQISALTFGASCCQGMFNGCTGIKLSATKTGAYGKAYRIPKSGDASFASSALSGMFAGTGGTFTGTPSGNTMYYLFGSEPAGISYKGETIASVGIGETKTLLCAGKYMEDNVEVDPGLNNVSVEYDGRLIAGVSGNIKRLLCAGKVMSTDLVFRIA